MVRVGLLRPPALKDADTWVRFLRAAPDSTTSTMPYPLTQFVKEHNSGVLASVVVEYTSDIAWGRSAEDQVRASFVSSNWFQEVGYGAAHGRVLSETLDTRDATPVVVVSDTFWRNRLRSPPAVVGRGG